MKDVNLNNVMCKGHHPVVEALLQHGAAVDQARTDIGETPLYVASWAGHHPVVEALLQHGAAVD